MSETVHTKEFDVSPMLTQHMTVPTIEATPAVIDDDDAALSAVGTVFFIIAIIALVLVLLAHPKGGSK